MSKITFLSVAAFKKVAGLTKLDIVLNSKSDKISVLGDDTTFYRCQQSIDPKGHMAFLIPDGILDDACLVNTSTEGSPLETQFSL
jgi:hypothetical protein